MGATGLLIVMCFVLAISALFLAVPIWAVVDAARRPDWQYQATGQSKTLWIVLPVVGLVMCGPVGLVAAIVYFASARPKLRQARPYDDTWSYGYDAPPPPPPGRRPGPPQG